MNRDSGDILDRWSISCLKNERIATEETAKEYKAFCRALEEVEKEYKDLDWEQIEEMIYSINDYIWQLEAGLKSGKDALPNPHYILDEMNNKTLAKIGATTILIRNINHLRIKFKNLINKLCKTGFQDTKKNHLSENHDFMEKRGDK